MEDEGIVMTTKVTVPQPKEPAQQFVSPMPQSIFSTMPGMFNQQHHQPMPMINYFSQHSRSNDQYGSQRRKTSTSSIANVAPSNNKINFDDQLSIDVVGCELYFSIYGRFFFKLISIYCYRIYLQLNSQSCRLTILSKF
jgi:hypothetical protein